MKEKTASIILIDDARDLLETYSEFLTLSGYSVRSFLTASAALDFLKSHSPSVDLFIVDMNMPQLSGIEFLKILRSKEMPSYNRTPFIILTGETNIQDIKDNHVIVCAKTNTLDTILKFVANSLQS